MLTQNVYVNWRRVYSEVLVAFLCSLALFTIIFFAEGGDPVAFLAMAIFLWVVSLVFYDNDIETRMVWRALAAISLLEFWVVGVLMCGVPEVIQLGYVFSGVFALGHVVIAFYQWAHEEYMWLSVYRFAGYVVLCGLCWVLLHWVLGV